MGLVELALLTAGVLALVAGTGVYGLARADERWVLAHRLLHQLGAGTLVVYVVAFRGRIDLVLFEVSFDLVGDPGVPEAAGLAVLAVAVGCYAILVGRWLNSVLHGVADAA